MNPRAKAVTPYLPRLVISLALLLGILNAHGQDRRFIISSSSNFETFDRQYGNDDTLHILISLPDMDYFNLEDAEYVLKPVHHTDGHFFSGDFENHLDGNYTTRLPLDAANRSIFEWELRIKVRDNTGLEFSMRIPITIGDPPDEDYDDNRLIEFAGRIRQMAENSIFVQGIWITVTDTTKIYDAEENRIAFEDFALGQEVKVVAFRLADGNVVAKFIKAFEKPEVGEEFEVRGRITHLADSALVVDGVRFHLTRGTEIFDEEENIVLFENLTLDNFVWLQGRVEDEQTLIALRIKVLSSAQDEKFEVSGPIEAVSDSSITVAGLEFLITERTELRGDDHFDLGFPALRRGLLVEVLALRGADNILWALRIKLDELPGTELEVEGEIELLGESFLVVDNHDFHVTEATVVLDADRNRADFTALATGMKVKVVGLELPDLRMFALRVMILKEPHERLKKEGRIESIAPNTLTVLGTAFEVDSTTQIYDEERNQIAMTGLQVGMFVRVNGFFRSPGNPFAEEIRVRRQHLEDVDVQAVIDSLGQETIYAAGLKFFVTERTIFLDSNDSEISFESLAPGVFAGIKGKRLPDGRNFALRVRIRNEAAGRIEIAGTLAAVNGDTIVVENTKLLATSETEFYDADEIPIGLNDFSGGDFVKIQAASNDGELPTVLRMQQHEAAGVSGAIGTAGGGVSETKPGGLSQLGGAEITHFTLLDTRVIVDDQTLIVGPLNTLVDASALLAGVLVDVQGTLTVEGELLAGTVTVIEQPVVTNVATPTANSLPSNFALAPNFPNPFNPSTTLRYTLNSEGSQRVVLNVFNILGQRVASLVDEVKAAGSYSVVWDGHDLAGRQVSTGLYVARLVVGNQAQVQRMLLSK